MSATLTVLAVSGTIEEGFELRKNIDWCSEDGSSYFNAVFLGQGLCRGAKMFLDVKEQGSREYDRSVPARVNPAMVLTGTASDANVYSVYLIDERACVNALLGEPRYLSMAPDALRLDLLDPLTSPRVVEFARAKLADANATSCAVLSVVAAYNSCRFVEAPPFEVREDGTRVTSFRKSLALFAGIEESVLGTPQWNGAVSAALARASAMLPAQAERTLYASTTEIGRLSSRISVEEARGFFKCAALGDLLVGGSLDAASLVDSRIGIAAPVAAQRRS